MTPIKYYNGNMYLMFLYVSQGHAIDALVPKKHLKSHANNGGMTYTNSTKNSPVRVQMCFDFFFNLDIPKNLRCNPNISSHVASQSTHNTFTWSFFTLLSDDIYHMFVLLQMNNATKPPTI